jgi:hypothetical protein
LLTEQEVSKNWRQLLSRVPLDEQTFVKAEALIDELRPESPLRHRLAGELSELRRLSRPAPTKPAKKAKAARAVKA